MDNLPRRRSRVMIRCSVLKFVQVKVQSLSAQKKFLTRREGLMFNKKTYRAKFAIDVLYNKSAELCCILRLWSRVSLEVHRVNQAARRAWGLSYPRHVYCS